MKRIIDYTIIVAIETEEMETEVKDRMSEGWQPFGSPFQGGKDMSYLMQALVKYED